MRSTAVMHGPAMERPTFRSAGRAADLKVGGSMGL